MKRKTGLASQNFLHQLRDEMLKKQAFFNFKKNFILVLVFAIIY